MLADVGVPRTGYHWPVIPTCLAVRGSLALFKELQCSFQSFHCAQLSSSLRAVRTDGSPEEGGPAGRGREGGKAEAGTWGVVEAWRRRAVLGEQHVGATRRGALGADWPAGGPDSTC